MKDDELDFFIWMTTYCEELNEHVHRLKDNCLKKRMKEFYQNFKQ